MIVSVLIMPLLLAGLGLYGFNIVTENHIQDQNRHVSKQQVLAIDKIPRIRTDLTDCQIELKSLSKETAKDDVRIDHVEQAIIELRKVYSDQKETNQKILDLLREMKTKG